jgi:hypothetical protein
MHPRQFDRGDFGLNETVAAFPDQLKEIVVI